MSRLPPDRLLSPSQVLRLLTPAIPRFVTAIDSSQNFCTVRFTVPTPQPSTPQITCGKGRTPNHAKAAALAEAAERYSLYFQNTEELVHASTQALGDSAISPATVQQFSPAQYANRGPGHHPPFHFPYIPPPCPPEEPLLWYSAWSATADRVVCLPAQHTLLSSPGKRRFVRSDSNGCAAGGSLEEAINFGLFELIERDAVAIWWANCIPRAPVQLPNNAEARSLIAQLRHASRELSLLDLSTDLPFPVFAAVSWCSRTNGKIGLAFGAHWHPVHAALRALRELLQVHGNHKISPNNYRPGSLEYAQLLWLRTATIETDPHLQPAGNSLPLRHFPALDTRDPIEILRHALAATNAAGMEILVQDLTRPEIRLPVARVTCPQLCLPWARYALPRLRLLPVQLGWRTTSLNEDQLNPVPFAM